MALFNNTVYIYMHTDNIMVQFSQGEYMVDESAGYVSLKVILSGQRYIPISFNYRVFVSNTEFKGLYNIWCIE